MTTHPFAIVVDLDGDGAHPAAWSVAAHAPRALFDGAIAARRATLAERAGFTAIAFDDSPLAPGSADAAHGGIAGRIDAVQRAAFAAPLTSAIGLIPVVHAVYGEPFHVATQLATVDLASDGRAGWISAVDADPRIAAQYGRDAVDPQIARADASDAVEVARLLWDSWEDDAVIRDTSTWRYVDRDRVHYADFVGRSYSVKGPSIIPRPPQGQLPIIASAVSGLPAGVDVALVETTDAAADARAAGAVRVWVELEVVLDRAGLPAAERLARLDRRSLWSPGPVRRYAGDAAGLVSLLTELAAVVDGVRIRPAVIEEDVDELGRAVIPELRHRGVFRSPRAGETLRESLGLPVAVNRHTGEVVSA